MADLDLFINLVMIPKNILMFPLFVFKSSSILCGRKVVPELFFRSLYVN